MWSAGEREEALRAISYTGFVQRGCSADEQVETDDRPDISTFTPDSSSRNRKKAYRVDFSYYGGDFDSFAWIPDGTSVLGNTIGWNGFDELQFCSFIECLCFCVFWERGD